MKRIKSLLSVFLVFIVCFSFFACMNSEEKELIGTYNAVSVKVQEYSQISISSYEYFTLELKSGKKAVVKSKPNGGAAYEASGTFKCKDGKLSIITRTGFASSITEEATVENGKITLSEQTIVNGQNITMEVVFEKILID